MKLSYYIKKTIDNRGKNPTRYYEYESHPVIDNILIKNTIYPDLTNVNRYIDDDTFKKFLRGYVHENMPLMTLVGNGIGNVTMAPNENACVIQNTIGFQTTHELDDIYFYYYLLNNQEKIRNFDRGSGQPSIRKTDILNMNVEFPNIEYQKKISEILFSLDKKILKNDEVNKNLEEQTRAIFEKMFPDTASGKKVVGDIITPKRGKGLLSKNAVVGNVPVIAGGLEPATYHNAANTKAPVLAISASGANAGYVSLWNIPIWSSDSSYIDCTMTDNVYFWYSLFKKRQNEIFDSQTGSAQPHIYPKHIASMPITEISSSTISKFTVLVTPMFEKIGYNNMENNYLVGLRDTLLPKFMSGELDVSNIDI